MTKEKDHLTEAMMLLEIAFFGGSKDWKGDHPFVGLDEADMAAMAHALIQAAFCGVEVDEFKKAKELVKNIKAISEIEDAQYSEQIEP